MRVLFLSNEYGFEKSGSAYGHRLDKLRRMIEQHGIETEFISLREQPISQPILAHPLNLAFIRKKVSDCDFIHAGGDATYTAVFLRRYAKTKIIYDVHGDTFSEAKLAMASSPCLRRAFWILQAWIANSVSYRLADYFLVVSKPLQQQLMNKWYIPENKIGLVRNGVDCRLFNKSNSAPADRFTICYAGGFQSWQGIDNLISAVERLSNNRICLRIIGFTRQKEELKSIIVKRLGNRVEMVDRVSQSELIAHLATAHVFIIPRFKHPAIEVALPTKFAEYLALGKPIFVCEVDETAELVRKHKCGFVSKPSIEAMAETIQAAANMTPAELKEMGDNARHLAEIEFSWDKIGRKYAEILTGWGSAA